MLYVNCFKVFFSVLQVKSLQRQRLAGWFGKCKSGSFFSSKLLYGKF